MMQTHLFQMALCNISICLKIFILSFVIYLFFVNFKITLFVTVIFILITLILVISLKDKFYLFSHNKALTEKFRFKIYQIHSFSKRH